MTRKNVERNAEIFNLRHIKKWTFDMIGIKFGLSRQRIQQMLGSGTGKGTGPQPRQARMIQQKEYGYSHPEKTNLEIAVDLGASESYVYPMRSGTRHARRGITNVNGNNAEELVSNLLLENGIENKLMPNRHAFDIKLSNGKRVEVKSRVKTTQIRNGKELYRFALIGENYQNARDRADFYILVLPDKTVFVIPSREIPDNTIAISFVLPEGFTGRKNKYWQYKDRFDLLRSPN